MQKRRVDAFFVVQLNEQLVSNVIELRDLIFTFKDKSHFLECSNRVTAVVRIITDDAHHIFYLNSMTLALSGKESIINIKLISHANH